jgi:hypothetical protein
MAAMRLIRNVGLYLGHLLNALIGTAIVTTPIWKFNHPASVAGILWQETIISICCAALIGFGVYMWRRSKIGAWIWTLPTVWFAFHALSVLSLAHSQSVLVPTGGLWPQIFGFDCTDKAAVTYCRNFFEFTVAFVRSVAYSLGTVGGFYFANPVTPPVIETKVVM